MKSLAMELGSCSFDIRFKLTRLLKLGIELMLMVCFGFIYRVYREFLISSFYLSNTLEDT